MNNNLQLSNEQEQALGMMLAGNNVFISGPAGTGKSMIINEFKARCNRNLVCLASTGIAAQAIGGTTLHSFFKLPMGIATPNSLNNFDHKQDELLKAVEVILIDEISMCRSDTFQAIDYLLRRATTPDKQCLPFGGTQVIVIGDFFQLPPVVDDVNIQLYLETALNGVYAFNTQAWCDAGFNHVLLNHVYRQADPFFIDLLDAVRHNTPELSSYLQLVNNKLVKYDLPGSSAAGNRLCICCTRRSADTINYTAMSKLPDVGFYNEGTIAGHFPCDDLPTAWNLTVKHDLKVILLANKFNQAIDGFDFVNGTVGTVIDYNSSKSSVTVKLDSGRTVTVGKHCWSNYEYELKVDNHGENYIEQIEVGQFYQLPLAPAYAITIHKAQGKTLDNAHIVLGNGCFVYGQLYTALSRVRSLNNLTIDRPIQYLEALVDPQVEDFYQCITQSMQSQLSIV